MKLGVYVGSFNPIHKGHQQVMEYILKNQYVDKIVLIPTPNYWYKTNLISLDHRLAMANTYASDQIMIGEEFAKYQYTYEIMEALHKKYPHDQLYLIMGADNVSSFHKWQHPEILLQHHVLVLTRGKGNMETCLDQSLSRERFIWLDSFPNIAISSTEIRRMIKKKNIMEVHSYVDGSVMNYIMKHQLYQ